MRFLSQSTGGITGTVRDDGGQPVAAGYAVASPTGLPYGRQSYTAVTSAKGDFAFSGMAPGNYSICLQIPGGQHLDPCNWSTPLQVTVSAGQNVAGQTVAVVKGRTIQIHLQDPNKLLGSVGPAEILIGIFQPSRIFQPLRVAANDVSGRTYDAIIPFDTPVNVSVSSQHLLIADQNGVALGHSAAVGAPSTSASVTVPASKSQGVIPINLTVTGKQ